MSPLLAQRPPNPDVDWIQLAIFALFFLIPIVGRILKAIGGTVATAGKSADRPARPRRSPPSTGGSGEDVSGEDLWRRLLRGEELPQPRPRLERQPTVPPAPVPEPLERERLAPLSVMGEVEEPGEVLAVTLETEQEPMALDTLAGALAAPVRNHPAARLVLDRSSLRHAILASEILGPPVSLRRS